MTERPLADEKFYKRTADRRQGRNRYASGSEGRVIQADSWQKRQNVAGRQLAEDRKHSDRQTIGKQQNVIGRQLLVDIKEQAGSLSRRHT